MERRRRPYLRHAYHYDERQHPQRYQDDYSYISEDEYPYYARRQPDDGSQPCPPSHYHEDELYPRSPYPPYARQAYRANDEQFIPPYFFDEESIPASPRVRPVAWHIVEVEDDDDVRYVSSAYAPSRRPRWRYPEQLRARRYPRRAYYCRIL